MGGVRAARQPVASGAWLAMWLLASVAAATCAPGDLAAQDRVAVPEKAAVPDKAAAADRAPRRKPDVGYYPTTQDVVEKMLELAKTQATDHVCDLGCGDGRFVITAAKRYGCRATGFEIDPKLVTQGQAAIRDARLEKKARIVEADIFTVDVSDVTVMMLFLLPDMNAKLVPQLQKMKAGSRILTHEFDIPGYVADRELVWVSGQDNSEHVIYIYTTPLQKAPAASGK